MTYEVGVRIHVLLTRLGSGPTCDSRGLGRDPHVTHEVGVGIHM